MPALEDKIVQGAVAEVLSAVYEADFLGSSYGFRLGRNASDMSTVLTVLAADPGCIRRMLADKGRDAD